MTPEELAELLEKLILKTDAAYIKALQKIQDNLYSDLAAIFKDIELDSQDRIKQSAANRKILVEAEKKIQSVYKSPQYINAVSAYIAAIPKIDSQAGEYFAAISDSFTANRVFLKDLQFDTIAMVEKYILQDGLQSQVVGPLVQMMSQNINAGGSYSGFLEQLRTHVKGDANVEARAMRYTRTFIRDTLFTYARSYQQAAANDLKLEFYFYSGGAIDTTRTFCLDRMGKYFHRREVELWANLEWSGKKADTTESSIFTFAGGWNCGHEIIPVSQAIVPKQTLERAREAGYIK